MVFVEGDNVVSGGRGYVSVLIFVCYDDSGRRSMSSISGSSIISDNS